MPLANGPERATPAVHVYSPGSYRAVTSLAPDRPVDLQLSSLRHEIAHLELVRNQITHAQSVIALVEPFTFNGEQPDFITLLFPGRGHLPSHLELGAATTFMTSTPRNVLVSGAAVSVLSNMTMHPAFVASTDGFTAYNVTFSPSASIRQYTAVRPFQDADQHVLQGLMPESGAWLSGQTGIQPFAAGESPDSGNTPMRCVELQLDAVPGLRRELRRAVSRRRGKLLRRLYRRQGSPVRLPRSMRQGLVLALLAVSRRYGRRTDSDDHDLPAYRLTSVVGGEPAMSC